MKVNIADVPTLERLLNRKKRQGGGGYAVDLGVILSEILTWANRLVPSASGSILLDDPLLKWHPEGRGQLFFAACFGRGSQTLVGTSLGEGCGIAGATYRTGKPYMSKDVQSDSRFLSVVDRKTGVQTRSIICAPIVIGGAKIGVIELINRKGKVSYGEHDLALLEIFAGYTATLIQNALIGRMFEELSRKDTLSDLHNDRFFFHSLEQEARKVVKHGGDLSLIFFDLDRFKEVNDTHGHLAGSLVLKEVADILRKIFIGVKAVLARYGGDEYVVVLPGANIHEAARYAEGIRHDIAKNVFLTTGDGVRVPRVCLKGIITCSIGVASMAESIKAAGNGRAVAESLIKAADSAMYSAKEQGKNRVCLARGVRRSAGRKRR
jgi:diguanylate cyclase (GGDEF)-like protein